MVEQIINELKAIKDVRDNHFTAEICRRLYGIGCLYVAVEKGFRTDLITCCVNDEYMYFNADVVTNRTYDFEDIHIEYFSITDVRIA